MIGDPLLGRVIGEKYRIDAEIGAGGMATIYRATRLHIGDAVAIKVLHSELLRDPQFAERFKREAQAAARLKHPNVVSIYDFGVSDDGVIYLVMELVEGPNLRTIIKDTGPMPVALAAEIIRQVCAALSEAERQHVVHRDIKPSNIAVESTPDGPRVKVLDFGIASLRSGGAATFFTQTGTALGTPAYMSPEQCLGEELDGRSDVYSVGVVLFEMLCGVAPFNSPTPTAVVMQHVQQAPPPLRILNASVSPAVEAVVLRSLVKRREDRYQTARDLADALTTAATGPRISLGPDTLATPAYAVRRLDATMVQPALAPAVPVGRSGGRASGVLIGLAVAAVLGLVGFGAQRAFFTHPATKTAAHTPARHRPQPARAAIARAPALRPPTAARSSDRYVVIACGAIVDLRTGLHWLVGPDTDFSWYAARAWAGSVSDCGTRWSLPSIRQLAALYDPAMSAGIGYAENGVHYPAHIDPIFSAIGHGSWIWSGEPGAYDNRARSFNFNQGLAIEDQPMRAVGIRVMVVRNPRAAPAANPLPYRPPAYARAGSPAETVRQYYARLNAHDFPGAYALLSPDFQAHFPFYRWRAGYATTLASTAEVPESTDPAHVPFRLVARDEKNGEIVTTVYDGAWALIPDGRGGWLLDEGRMGLVSDH
ncbi:MAG: protein kinase [Candidatus Eremiobacteraeota bacterium]|nr:protein kinase [Candidatus Eremiobacteraeota bacterium]